MTDLLSRIVEFCRGRQFSVPDEIYAAFLEASRHVMDNKLLDAKCRDLLVVDVEERAMLDGDVTIISNIRG
ncbi:MAG: hypothetical protein OXD40_13005 [bacterium]|nr:hypothetical protein [bacterium]